MSEKDMNKEMPEQAGAQGTTEEQSPELLARQQERERFRREREEAMRAAPPVRRMPNSRMGRFQFRMRRFTAKNRRLMLILLVTALACVVLIASILVVYRLAIQTDMTIDSSYLGNGNYQGSSPDDVEQIAIIPLNAEEVKLVEDVLIAYADKYNTDTSARNLLSSHRLTNYRLDYEKNVTIEYVINNLAERHRDIRRVYAIVSEYADYSSPKVFYADSFAQKSSIVCTHLKPGTTYYFRIVAEFSGGATLTTEDGEQTKFTTKQSPRFVTIANAYNSYLYNVRDLGGWMTVETDEGTKRIRQGLIYRGCELDGINDRECMISQSSGVSTMVGTLGIRTVVDMRSKDEGGIAGYCPLGSAVNYVRIPGTFGYGNVHTSEEVNQTHEFVRKSFELLADPDNYPIYIHDMYGNKEVGMICYLLETVLGVDQTQRSKDFFMSEFSTKNTTKDGTIDSICSTFVGMINQFGEGNNEEERVRNFLIVSCRVTPDQINSIQNILLEDVVSQP